MKTSKAQICIGLIIISLIIGLFGGIWIGWNTAPMQKWVDDINKTLRFKVASAHMSVKILEITKEEISFEVFKYPGNETVNFTLKAKAGLEILPAGKIKNVQFIDNAVSVVVEDYGNGYAKVTFDFDNERMSEIGQQRYYFDFYGYDSANLPIAFVSIQGDRFLPVSVKK